MSGGPRPTHAVADLTKCYWPYLITGEESRHVQARGKNQTDHIGPDRDYNAQYVPGGDMARVRRKSGHGRHDSDHRTALPHPLPTPPNARRPLRSQIANNNPHLRILILIKRTRSLNVFRSATFECTRLSVCVCVCGYVL